MICMINVLQVKGAERERERKKEGEDGKRSDVSGGMERDWKRD